MVAQPSLNVLLTRPKAQSRAFAATLPDHICFVISPLLRIETAQSVPALGDGATALFTSVNGVRAYLAYQGARGAPAICVGDRTTAEAEAAGFDARSAGGTAEDVVALALTKPGPFTHYRGAHARGDIVPRLRAAGRNAIDVVAYDQLPCPLSQTAAQLLHGPCIVPLFSPRTAALFAESCPTAPKAQILCMSASVAKMLPQHAYGGIEVVPKPTAAAMRDAVLARAAGNHLEGR